LQTEQESGNLASGEGIIRMNLPAQPSVCSIPYMRQSPSSQYMAPCGIYFFLMLKKENFNDKIFDVWKQLNAI
jgi:hypothetical protein